MELSRIKDKIRAILAKADDGSGATEAEAENALRFARRLMLQNNLTEQDVSAPRDAHETAADAEAVEYGKRAAFTSGARKTQWEITLGHAVRDLVGTVHYFSSPSTLARRDGCVILDEATGQPRRAVPFTYYGPDADARDAVELFEEWSLAICALARMRFGGAFRGPGRSYAEGFARALFDKVGAIKDDERARIREVREAESAHPSEKALVVRTENALALMSAKRDKAQAWLRESQGIKLRSSSRSAGGQHHGDAHAAGRADGRSANFSREKRGRLNSGR